jgi:secernin
MHAWSCDTFAALPDATPDGVMIVGKNSDRPVSDAQPLRFLPRRQATGTATVRLAYVTLPDADVSYAHLGGSPYWCWGHELGLNEWGVAIGNEAVYTRDLADNVAAARRGEARPTGLLGMELVRLGLERGRTAQESLTAMCALVEEYGQWGSGVPGEAPSSGAYDNSYLIADSREVWVLETSGTRSVARRVDRGTYAISNQLTIRTAWDRASDDLIDHAVERGWWPAERGSFDFARAYSDPRTPLQVSQIRLQRSRELLATATASGGVDLDSAKRILRDHYEGTFLGGPYFNAATPDFLTLCMHSHPAGFTWGNTASSAIFVLPDGEDALPYMWWTPVTPCTGVYLPVFVGAGTVPEAFATAGPAAGPSRPEDAAEDGYDRRSYWWRFRRLLDTVKGDEEMAWHFADRQPIVRQAFDALERRWTHELPGVRKQALDHRAAGDETACAVLLARFTDACAREALDVLDDLLGRFQGDGHGRPA